MTFYNASIKTHLVDPVFDTSNFRTEFRLNPDTVYLSNMRLCNLGVTAAGAVAAGYQCLAGCMATISSIQLLDGNQLLDQLLQANLFAAFQQYNKSNSHNVSMETFTAKNTLGYDVRVAGGVKKMAAAYANAGLNTALDTTALGWISLGQLLPFLRAQSYVPSNVFANLRLVIEYEQTAATICPQIGANGPVATQQPLLIVDELTNESVKSQIMKRYKGASWNSIEHDRVVVPEEATPANAAADHTKSLTFTVNGFDNKTVHRMLIVASPQVAAANSNGIFGVLGSKAQHQTAIQIRINGANVFARSGVTNINERLARLTDSWGSCNTMTNFPGISGTDGDEVIDRDRLGETDYFGCTIAQSVSEMQIDFARRIKSTFGGANAADGNDGLRYRQAIFLNIFCEVPKQLVVRDGGYNVLYS